ncbi:hypothetical protein P154DRAFT_18033 [Amniculicola lignicola CBS 123094]|uniref:Uncharacterized protein n=1 Tax=Amniculicola lignicola CBS 123094 TaxID=1392246 RepID=A0A6A5X5U7_9PLEO|nr:hypothetical protein P154DRAFT_18033 [Amniculicola lignicola CBS 123094]
MALAKLALTTSTRIDCGLSCRKTLGLFLYICFIIRLSITIQIRRLVCHHSVPHLTDRNSVITTSANKALQPVCGVVAEGVRQACWAGICSSAFSTAIISCGYHLP